MNTESIDIMERAEMLPIDMKIELVDRLLESIGPSRKEIDELWKIEIERRVDEVRSGTVETIPGKLAAWTSASHIEKDPKKSETPNP